jgi:hypothetical protein
MPCRLRRWGRVGRRFRPLGRRLWRRLRRGVILRRRRDNDQRRRKILGGRRSRRSKRDQRQRGSTSNGVRLHGRVSCVRFARGTARPARAPARGENPIWSALANSPIRASVAHLIAVLRPYTAIRRANSSAPVPRGTRASLPVVVNPQACGKRSDRPPRQLPNACGAEKSAAIASDDQAGVKRGCLAADAHAAAPIAVRTISGAHHCGAVVAVWPMPSSHRATGSDAPSMIATSGAGGRISLRNLNRQQAESQQARSNHFHRYPPYE